MIILIFKMCTWIVFQMHMLSGFTCEYKGLSFLWISKQFSERGWKGESWFRCCVENHGSEAGVLTPLLLVNAPSPSSCLQTGKT